MILHSSRTQAVIQRQIKSRCFTIIRSDDPTQESPDAPPVSPDESAAIISVIRTHDLTALPEAYSYFTQHRPSPAILTPDFVLAIMQDACVVDSDFGHLALLVVLNCVYASILKIEDFLACLNPVDLYNHCRSDLTPDTFRYFSVFFDSSPRLFLFAAENGLFSGLTDLHVADDYDNQIQCEKALELLCLIVHNSFVFGVDISVLLQAFMIRISNILNMGNIGADGETLALKLLFHCFAIGLGSVLESFVRGPVFDIILSFWSPDNCERTRYLGLIILQISAAQHLEIVRSALQRRQFSTWLSTCCQTQWDEVSSLYVTALALYLWDNPAAVADLIANGFADRIGFFFVEGSFTMKIAASQFFSAFPAAMRNESVREYVRKCRVASALASFLGELENDDMQRAVLGAIYDFIEAFAPEPVDLGEEDVAAIAEIPDELAQLILEKLSGAEPDSVLG
jgi:hypothetical protein